MMDNKVINTLGSPSFPIIYAYTLPGIEYRKGWIKIGQTSTDAEKRIKEQTKTAGIRTKLEWQDYALYKDGSGQTFADKQFHSWMVRKKGVERIEEDGVGNELFHLDAKTSKKYFDQFANREIPVSEEHATYILRKEQQDAVDLTKAYFESDAEGQEFLWNAKPRFGKTLTTYALIQEMSLKKVLVVSNRPSISNSWAEDFYKFLSWKGEYSFVSDNDALKIGKNDSNREYKKCILTRQDYLDNKNAPRPMIAFESLQGLKGSVYFGGDYDKLQWIKDLEFDLLIVDESHEGVDTVKTERAFDNIRRKHTLYLSGTPFKQLANADFDADQIFNWSYADEQEAKQKWQGQGVNPYERLPRLCMFTYQMSQMIRDKARKGIVIAEGEDAVDYAFDLNEFFLTNDRGRFVHEEDVKKFLHALYTQEKYPFSTPELRKSLSHTMWYMNRVASAKALAKLLAEDEVFREYKVVLAVGDARDENSPDLKAYDQVKNAIKTHDKTITLTVGVTIPEWSAVMMLCNMSSPSAYMQAAFRAQNPCFELVGEELLMKENAYVFDFDPARTLVIFDEFATNLSRETAGGGGTGENREEKIKRLLNFLPVIGEDEAGKMVELEATQVLSIPRRLKSQEVVNRGFMSNFLFQNIGNIFSAPEAVRKIIENLPTASEEKRKPKPGALANIDHIPINKDGDVTVPDSLAIGQAQGMFGDKIYGFVKDETQNAEKIIDGKKENGDIYATAKEIGQSLKDRIKEAIIDPLAKDKGITKSSQQKLEKKTGETIDRAMNKIAGDYEQAGKIAQAVYEKERKQAKNESEVRAAEQKRDISLNKALDEFKSSITTAIDNIVTEKPVDVIKEIETSKAVEEKKGIENEVRAHLRGFARTIPSFIMAYGDENLKLSNFDSYVKPDVFKQVTGITMENFLFLRDGGEYTDNATGKTEHFNGHLFDEVVFNDSVQEFLKKKEKLANYFDEKQEEDIFDYIPPQKTNQIFTPRSVVSLMLDLLEKENPGCFDDPDKTFADLYMKSGLYITEIVKRLYRSKALKAKFKDDKERIRHILEKQVYGMAPTEIIYRIATNYILGFDPEMEELKHNFQLADTVKAAKNGKLNDLVDEKFPG